MINVAYDIERLLKFALRKEMISKWDIVPTRNSLLEILKVEAPFEGEVIDDGCETAVSILKNILDYAVAEGIILEDTITHRDLLDAKIMGVLMPRQGEVINTFYNRVKDGGIKEGTDWFYDLSRSSNYIMTERIAKNLWWTTGTEYGDLEITVNLSKPEKDPKEIAMAKLVKQSNYPKCLLCVDNVGYAGRLNHPARQNHRVIPLELKKEQWFFQYSPYVYYNEHCIVFNGEHAPMKLTRSTLERLVDFIDLFPHYFIGSNADLPIVGGSILTHDHYQGGRHKFAMEKAKVEKIYENHKFEGVKIGTVNWPMTVIRLNSNSKSRIVDAAMTIYEAWKKYSDESNEVLAFTGEIPHNTVTPIARRNGELYEIDIVLRNNRTSEAYPEGIFHPHRELHHIKKENIGLIEVMGLAVLPGRLETELDIIANILSENIVYSKESALDNEDISKHVPWIENMLGKYKNITLQEAKIIVKEEVGMIFSKVLEHAGVFKRNEKGQKALEAFLNSVL